MLFDIGHFIRAEGRSHLAGGLAAANQGKHWSYFHSDQGFHQESLFFCAFPFSCVSPANMG
jgi:hypothetical protein